MRENLGAGARMRIASQWIARVRGLLGTRARGGEVLLIAPCSSIHTFGMAYAIDVAFVSKCGEVIGVYEALPPRKVARCRGAVAVLERASLGGLWYRVGDELSLGPCASGRKGGKDNGV